MCLRGARYQAVGDTRLRAHTSSSVVGQCTNGFCPIAVHGASQRTKSKVAGANGGRGTSALPDGASDGAAASGARTGATVPWGRAAVAAARAASRVVSEPPAPCRRIICSTTCTRATRVEMRVQRIRNRASRTARARAHACDTPHETLQHAMQHTTRRCEAVRDLSGDCLRRPPAHHLQAKRPLGQKSPADLVSSAHMPGSLACGDCAFQRHITTRPVQQWHWSRNPKAERQRNRKKPRTNACAAAAAPRKATRLQSARRVVAARPTAHGAELSTSPSRRASAAPTGPVAGRVAGMCTHTQASAH